VKHAVIELVLWAFLGAFTGYEIGQTIRIYQNWPAPPAGYVWKHVA
jgi:hypothetical protein